MKKLNKLSINPEKVIKNDELTNLRGGYEPCDCPNEGHKWMCYCAIPQTYIFACTPILLNQYCEGGWECSDWDTCV